MPNQEVILWIGGVCMGLIGGLLLILWKVVDARHKDHGDKIDTLIKSNATIEAKIELWWKSLGSKAAKILHSPHTPELDGLLEKVQAEQLSASELSRLTLLLEEMENDKTEELPRRELAAHLLVTLCAKYSLREFAGLGMMSG